MEIKKFENYKDNMNSEEILLFAKFGFICKQILNDNLFFKELKK